MSTRRRSRILIARSGSRNQSLIFSKDEVLLGEGNAVVTPHSANITEHVRYLKPPPRIWKLVIKPPAKECWVGESW